MIARGARVIVLGVVAAAGNACSSTAPTPPPPRIIARPIQVDSVEVALAPPSAHVRGVIGDGCTELSGVSIARSENNVTVTIFGTRPEGAICIQIAKLYDATLALPGDFPPGQYVLRVNSVEKTFSVP
jgi:hypothetical protein